MGAKSSLLVVKRSKIVALHIKKLLERQIAKRSQCSKSSVDSVIKKFKKNKIYDDMKKTGRPVKLYEEMIMPSDELLCYTPLVLVLKYVPIC